MRGSLSRPWAWRMDGTPGYIRMIGTSLKQLIGFAYDVEGYRITAQGPIFSELYDVRAKIPEDVTRISDAERWARIHVMTQAMLASRFQLTLHRATTEMQVLALVAGKSGVKIKEIGPGPGENVIVNRHAGHLSAEQMPMSQLVSILRSELKQPVIDMTGIKGVFDVKLDWAPDQGDGNLPSLFTAIEEQLGLKLRAEKQPIEILIVDRAQRPSEN